MVLPPQGLNLITWNKTKVIKILYWPDGDWIYAHDISNSLLFEIKSEMFSAMELPAKMDEDQIDAFINEKCLNL